MEPGGGAWSMVAPCAPLRFPSPLWGGEAAAGVGVSHAHPLLATGGRLLAPRRRRAHPVIPGLDPGTQPDAPVAPAGPPLPNTCHRPPDALEHRHVPAHLPPPEFPRPLWHAAPRQGLAAGGDFAAAGVCPLRRRGPRQPRDLCRARQGGPQLAEPRCDRSGAQDDGRGRDAGDPVGQADRRPQDARQGAAGHHGQLQHRRPMGQGRGVL